MKNVLAISVLLVLLINWVGLQLYTAIVENTANRNVFIRLDIDLFSDADLVSIKIAAAYSSPSPNQKEFERVNGQIETQGTVYNYVKRRFMQDSVEFLCVPNDSATLLRIAKYDLFKLVTDLQAEQSKKTNTNNSVHKNLNGDYFPETNRTLFSGDPSSNLPIADGRVADPTAGFPDFDEHPPQLNA